MHGQSLTSGNINKQLWSLAWPIMLSIFFHTLYNIVDAFWVGKLGPNAIGAVSISQITLFIMVSLSMGITIGSGVLMAMKIGAKDMGEAQRILAQSFVLAAIAGLFFTIVSLMFQSTLLSATGATGEILPLALEYFSITAAGAILMFLMMSVVFGFNAQGDNFTMTKIFAFSTLVNVILDPILIFGLFGFPALEIAGAAYATLFSQFLAVSIGIFMLRSKKMMIPFKFSKLSFEWNSVKKVLDIGIPASLTQVLGPVGMAAITYLTGIYFLESGANSYALGFRIEFFAFLPAIGYGAASMAMLGQNIGAGNIDRAKKAYKKALKTGFIMASAFGLLIILLRSPIIKAFTQGPTVIEYTSSYMLIVPISYGFLAAGMISAFSFQGIGKSWPGFWTNAIRIFVLMVPAALIAVHIFNSPIYGIWIAIVIGNIGSAIIAYLWFEKKISSTKAEKATLHKQP